MQPTLNHLEAPEFTQLSSEVENGFLKANKAIRAANTFPIGKSHDYFKTYTDFNIVTCKIIDNIVLQANQIMITELPSVKLKCNDYDEENNMEKIIDANDSLLDRIYMNIDSLSGVNEPSEAFMNGISAAWNRAPVLATVKMGSTTLFGATNIARPQISFKDVIDNKERIWRPKVVGEPHKCVKLIHDENGDPIGYEHPYQQELELYNPPEPALIDTTASCPPVVEETPLTIVDTMPTLNKLIEHLETVFEIAVDLEHHSYRSFQGFTCLIQISTIEGGDFIIDAIALREHLHKLNPIFVDATKIKILHGATNDVLWLQRDFGVYIVGLFDTYEAAKVLELQGPLTLKGLISKYYNINIDKKFQLADWRIRPLPEELIAYARMDTHYLIHIWHLMKHDLLQKAGGQYLLRKVFSNCLRICLLKYEVPVLTPTSHLKIYCNTGKKFNSNQMSALAKLYSWRNSCARELDESETYLMPNRMLLSLAETLPREMQDISTCCFPTPPFLKQNIAAVHNIILSCREPSDTSLTTKITSASWPLPPPRNYEAHDLSSEAQNIGEHPQPTLPTETNNTCADMLDFSILQSDALQKNDLNIHTVICFSPYDRYNFYQSLRKVDDAKDTKREEAKMPVSSGKYEQTDEEVIKLKAGVTSPAESQDRSNDGEASVVPSEQNQNEPVYFRNPHIFQRKLKSNENKPKPTQPEHMTNTEKKNIEAKSSVYKKINYQKFYSSVEKKGKKRSK